MLADHRAFSSVFPGRGVRQVGNPEPVRSIPLKAAVDQIIGPRCVLVRDGRSLLLAHLIPLRTTITHRHVKQELLRPGGDLRRCRSPRRHGRPLGPPCPSHRSERPELPTPGQNERRSPTNHPLDRATLNRPRPRNTQPALTAGTVQCFSGGGARSFPVVAAAGVCIRSLGSGNQPPDHDTDRYTDGDRDQWTEATLLVGCR